MAWKVDFTCDAYPVGNGCGAEFEAEWSFGDEITCPSCGRVYETDYETNSGDDIQGPWLTKELSGPTKPPSRQA